MKKILSLVLAIVLAASAFLAAPLQLPGLVVAASAEEATEPSEGGNAGGEGEAIPEPEFAFELNSDGQGYSVHSTSATTGDVVIPAEYNGLPVTVILYIRGENVTSITMPDTITLIDQYAFSGNKALESVTISKNLKEISWGAFEDCTALKSVIIPQGVELINENAFWGCSSLAEVSIADSVTYISDYAFLETEFYTNPNNWENGALYCDNHLLSARNNNDESFRVKKGTVHIAIGAFSDRDNLVSLYIPKSVKTFGAGCFSQCDNITFIFYEGTVDEFNKINFNGIDTGYELAEALVILEADGVGKPNKVTTKSVSNVAGGLKVTWGAVANADLYLVWRRGAGNSDWQLLGITDQTSVVDTSAGHRQYWRYSVQAMNADDLSDFDYTGKYQKYVATPKLTGISNATNGIYFKWNAVSGASGYRVYRRASGSSTWTYLGTVKGTGYTDTGVKNANNKYYRYTVRAVVDGLYSGYEDFLYTKRVVNPKLISATNTSSGISVKWNAVSGTTGYYVYRKTAGSGWVKVGTCYGTKSTTFVDKTAKKGTTYTYTVRAAAGKTTSYFNSGISCKRK